MHTFENGFKNYPAMPAFVLRGKSPEDVGRVMITDGLQKQPFIIFDMDEAYRRIQHFKDMMPRVKIFYAMKSNDTDMMLKLAISQGVGFDCASPGEIYKLRKLNVCPTSIIYAMPTKTPEQMVYARESGVRHTTFDSSYELKKCAEHWPDARGIKPVEPTHSCYRRYCLQRGSTTETEAVDLLEEAASLGLKVVGVAFHVGSICSTPESYVTGLKYARALFDHEAQAGREMKIVDFGGGFYSDTEDGIDQVFKVINVSLEELFPDPQIQVIAEPGRYLCESAFTMYCSINNVRTATKNEKQTNMVYINDGIYGCLRHLEKWNAPIKFMQTKNYLTEYEEVLLWGPSCDSLDNIMKNVTVRLPRCMVSDWLIFPNIGAYSITISTRFSCLEVPLIRSVVSFELWNQLKDSEIFAPKDFATDPDISTPLPVILPPLLPECIYEYKHSPKLNI